jgi:hypothetical protein
MSRGGGRYSDILSRYWQLYMQGYQQDVAQGATNRGTAESGYITVGHVGGLAPWFGWIVILR